MKLTELNARFIGAGGEGVYRKDPTTGSLVSVPVRTGVGVIFDCPCGCDSECYIPFDKPLDGRSPLGDDIGKTWQRTGDTIECLTLRPSILRIGGCAWHGFITNGEAVKC